MAAVVPKTCLENLVAAGALTDKAVALHVGNEFDGHGCKAYGHGNVRKDVGIVWLPGEQQGRHHAEKDQ